MDSTEWLSVYLFVGRTKFEQVITEFVAPFVEQLESNKLLHGFFFIRYFDNGPHVRLRIKSDITIIETKIKQLLAREVEKFALAAPGVISHYIFQSYEPEVERYGGIDSLPVAEEQFGASSKAVIAAIRSQPEWDYSTALGSAISMHLAFLHAIQMNVQQATSLLNRIYKTWFYAASAYYVIYVNAAADEQKASASIDEAFNKSYAGQEEHLRQFSGDLMQAIAEGRELPEGLAEWITAIRNMHKKMLLLGEQELVMADKEKEVHDKISEVYESLFHMTNNRLGISNMDEAFLGFILLQLFKSNQLCEN